MRLPLIVLCLLFALTACGKKGALETPQPKNTEPKNIEQGEEQPQENKSSRKFILDPFLF